MTSAEQCVIVGNVKAVKRFPSSLKVPEPTGDSWGAMEGTYCSASVSSLALRLSSDWLFLSCILYDKLVIVSWGIRQASTFERVHCLTRLLPASRVEIVLVSTGTPSMCQRESLTFSNVKARGLRQWSLACVYFWKHAVFIF